MDDVPNPTLSQDMPPVVGNLYRIVDSNSPLKGRLVMILQPGDAPATWIVNDVADGWVGAATEQMLGQ